MVSYLGSLVQLCYVEGGTLHTSIAGMWGVLLVYGPHWVCPSSLVCAFQVYTAQAPGGSAGAPSKAGSAFRALPRSKLLRFGFSGTPQGHRLCWACIFCPSQVRALQVTRCLASALSRWTVCLHHLPGPGCSVSWVCCDSTVSGVPCVSSGGLISGCYLLADVNCPASQEDVVSNWEPAHSLV